MFFYASKLAWFALSPSNLFTAIACLGVCLAFSRFARAGRRIAAAGLALLLLGGLSPLANWMIAPLEQRFPDWRGEAHAPPDGIIILGGAVDADISARRRFPLELNEAGDRVMALIELARRFPAARLVVSGGVGGLAEEAGIEADEIKGKIAAYGVDPARLIVENRSRTTAENAVLTRDLAKPKPGERWLLVTSAWHMPRAVGCFRQAGFAVEAYPVDYRTAGDATSLRPFGDVASGLRRLDVAAKEWIGLIAYRATGRIDAILPGP